MSMSQHRWTYCSELQKQKGRPRQTSTNCRRVCENVWSDLDLQLHRSWETVLKQDFWHLGKVPWVNMLLCSLFHFLSTVCFLFLCLWFWTFYICVFIEYMLWKCGLQVWNSFLYTLNFKLYWKNILEKFNSPMFLFYKSINQLSAGSENVLRNLFALDPFWVHLQDDCQGSQFYVGAPFSSTLVKISCPVMKCSYVPSSETDRGFTWVSIYLRGFVWVSISRFLFRAKALSQLFLLHHRICSYRENTGFPIFVGDVGCWLYVTGVSAFIT